MKKTINCMGMACPLPVVNAKKAFEEFTETGTLIVQVDNETAVNNVSKLAARYGFAASSRQTGDKAYEIEIEVTPEKAQQQEQAAPGCGGGPLVVVLSSNVMGTGDDKLGKALMKSYIFALTNVYPVPDTILCYNGGAFLTTEGSDSLEDLQNLEAAGTKIITCGTCLNFYGLTDKVKVGTVGNMYDIADILSHAGRIVRP